nr:transposase [Desulfobulbaceae bacterium]
MILREVFHLALRQTQGLVSSLMDLLKTEFLLKCVALNKMTQIGMPLSHQMF